MSGLWEVARETLRFLSSREELADLAFCEDFPAAAKESPLRRITVAIGLEQANCVPDFLGQLCGEQAGNALTGAPWALRIRLQIHAPNRLGGAACREAFSRIWEALYFDAPFPVTAAGCGPVSARRETGSLELDAWVEYSVFLARLKKEGEA